MKKSLILCLVFLSTGCVMGSYHPTDKCLRAGILVETIDIEQQEVNDTNIVKTYIHCERLR